MVLICHQLKFATPKISITTAPFEKIPAPYAIRDLMLELP
jgi:hypothetical protein